MFVACVLQALSGYFLIGFSNDINQDNLALTMVLQGFSVGLCWVPMTVVTFWTLDAQYRAEAMSMFHLLRNFGSSLFISVAVAEIIRSTGANYARLTENVSPFNRAFELPWASGGWSIETAQSMARFGREITRQATLIGYNNAFVMFTWVAAAMVPLILFARLPKQPTAK
ncbi:MAG: hypothetical protein AAGJ53_06905 [Pseudomonadota bacterium]